MMNAQPVGYKAKAFEARNLAFFFLIVFGLEAIMWVLSTIFEPEKRNSLTDPSVLFWALVVVPTVIGPTLSAFLMTAITEGRSGVKILGRCFWNRNLSIKWLLVTLLAYELLRLVTNLVVRTIDGQPSPWTRTYPIGLDVEACTFTVLAKAWKEAKEPQHREHAMPYFYEGVELTRQSRTLETGTSSRGFQVALLHHTTDFGDYRWTVDTPEDLEFMRQVYGHFDGRDDFTWKEVLDLVQDNPELMKINSGVQHKSLKDIDKGALN